MHLTDRMPENHDSDDTRDTLMLLSGAALVMFGAGLILSTPPVRKLLGGVGIGTLLSGRRARFSALSETQGNVTTPNPINATPASTTVYSLDPGVSRFTARAFATGLLASLGHNPSFAIRQFTGEAKFSAKRRSNRRYASLCKRYRLNCRTR